MVRRESELVAHRDEAFYREYKKALGSGRDISHNEAVVIALHAPQPKMWVSFYGVYRLLLRIVYHSREAPRNLARKSLEAEVAIKYERLRKQRAFQQASLPFLASFIIAEPAIGFYMSEAYAKKVVNRMRKKHRSAWLKAHSKDSTQQHSC